MCKVNTCVFLWYCAMKRVYRYYGIVLWSISMLFTAAFLSFGGYAIPHYTSYKHPDDILS